MGLATTVLDANAERFVLFLHGILGSRANWRSIARRVLRRRAERGESVGAILVDLRMHGESQSFQPPHLVASAASDLLSLETVVDGRPIEGVVGHSFGGKVAMAYAQATPAELKRLWIIDSAPGPVSLETASSQTSRVLVTLKSLPRSWPSREAFVDAVCDDGHPKPIAQWLAMNLTSAPPPGEPPPEDEGGLWFPLDLSAIESLLADYAAQDLWSVIEAPPDGLDVDVIVGGASDVWSPQDRDRIKGTPSRLHVVEGAGHWVHVDSAETVIQLLAE